LVFTNAKALSGYNVRPSVENEFPSIACLARYNPNLNWQQNLLCTATLISPKYILTAEHCFTSASENQIEVVVGAHNIENGVRHYPIWWISFNQWSLNQGENVDDDYNDILIAMVNSS
jgi:V8-like Glu-specific endopeptidase